MVFPLPSHAIAGSGRRGSARQMPIAEDRLPVDGSLVVGGNLHVFAVYHAVTNRTSCAPKTSTSPPLMVTVLESGIWLMRQVMVGLAMALTTSSSLDVQA